MLLKEDFYKNAVCFVCILYTVIMHREYLIEKRYLGFAGFPTDNL